MQKNETPIIPFTPSSRVRTPSEASRFISGRKQDHVPGFDLVTPSKLSSFENCFIYKSLKSQDSSILSAVFESSQVNWLNSSTSRIFPSQAERILDAPEIVEDYYLNLLSWSDLNLLAVALRGKLYIWNGNTGNVELLKEYNNEIITSVSWMKGGKCLAVGDSSHLVKLIDVEKNSEIRNIRSHSDRVSSLAWNGYVLSSGSRDATVVNHDLRVQDYFVKYLAHTQEICGLKWNTENSMLASGGNDNKVCLWDLSSNQAIFELKEHKAAVKALSWCPWKPNLLATGGGSIDRTIKLWDCQTGSTILSKDTGSQISALEWNAFDKELISAHGYTKNQLSLWKASDLAPVAEFYGHSARILNMCLSPDHTTVVTAGADETLRFWKLFSDPEKRDKTDSPGTKMGQGYR